MNIIGNVTVNGDIIESGATKTVNNYYGESCSKEDSTCQGSQSSKEADVFDRAMIESFVIDSHPHLVAEILMSLMLPLCGKNKPKAALLPLYCAIDLGVVRKPSYEEFNAAFHVLEIRKSSYSEYLPNNKDETKYKEKEIERMSEALTSQLHEKIK